MHSTSRALVLLAVLLAAGLAPPASAQTGQADLEITLISVSNPRHLVPSPLTVHVENRGTAAFDTTRGWEIFIGWNGVAESQCINENALNNADQPCHLRFPPGLNPSIAPGQKLTYTVDWTPSQGYDQRGEGQIYGLIMPFGTVPNEGHRTNPPTMPGENSANNVRSFLVTVQAPKVRAMPARDAAPEETDKNVFWRWEQVEKECLKPTDVTTFGCRAKPGTDVRFAYTVHNLGTGTDSFVGEVVYASPSDQQALAAKGYRFTLNPSTVTVPAGGSQTVHLDVHVPESELHNEGVNINNTADPSPAAYLRWYSRENPAVHTSAEGHCKPDPLCVDPSLPTLVAGMRRGMNVTSNETYKVARAGHPISFNLRIENAGNYVDSFNVTILEERSTLNATWRPRITVPATIPARAAANATIDLFPPDDAVRGPYVMDVRVRSLGDPTGAAVTNLTFTADLQQRFGVLATLLPSSREVAPGEKAQYALTVTNTGNGPDNATVALGNLPGGWDVALADPVLRLPPRGEASTLLNVTAPPGMAAGAKAEVKVQVTSQGSNDASGQPLEKAPEVTATALVLSRPNPEMTLDGVAKRFVDAGGHTDYVLTVRNVGNVASNFTLATDNPDPAWAVTATPSYLVLDPLQSGTITVRLRAPGDATVGETLRVIATITSAADPARFDQETLIGAVSGSDLAVKGVLPNATAPYSGDPLALDVVLANEGNKAPGKNVTLRALFLQGGVERVIAERDYSSSDLPGGRRLVERLVWDTAGVEGAGVIVVRIDPSDAIREIDDSAASNEASVAVTLRTFDVTVTPPQGLSGRPGEKVTYGEKPHVFLVRHRGNSATEPVQVLVESQNGWVPEQARTLSLELPKGAEVPVPVDVLIPLRPGVAVDSLRVTVVPALRPGSVVSAATTTRVVDEEKPVILRTAADPATVKLGQNVTLEALVQDATGVASVTAHLVSPTNDTTVLPMAHVGGDRWVLAQTFNVAGRHRFFVEAVDRAEPANRNASRDDLAEFFVDPGSAPTILLAEGQATTIRTGTPVRLNITDPLGVARAAYVIRGITYEMTRPYQIDTSSFPAGSVEVAVEAENVYGVKSTARFTLTIDNAPPGIRSVRLNPENPAINEDAVLTIETDPKVTAVDVLIRKNGQVVETRAAERKGPGLFELLLNPGEGDYVLDVTAKDEAGNVKLQEGAVKFSAKPKSPFDVPGPGAWATLLALLAAVFLAGRRR